MPGTSLAPKIPFVRFSRSRKRTLTIRTQNRLSFLRGNFCEKSLILAAALAVCAAPCIAQHINAAGATFP